jgi:DegV family protein with EDD domain
MGKKQVAIATDSVANIPVDLIKEYDIKVIPQCLNWVGETYLDGIDITADEFYQQLGSAKELPTTSQPSAGEFREFFLEIAEGCESIVCIVVSDHLSGTLDSANAAVKMIPDFPIEVVDSRSASMGQGFIVLAAANAVSEGKSYTEVAELARGLVPNVRAVFVVDTLEFLHRGGRIGGAQRLVGSVLSIKPLLHLVDGKIEPLASVRTKRKALDRALDIIAEDAAGKGPLHAAVLHASTPDEAEKFYSTVKERFIGTHTGPGLVGLAYYNES